MKDNPDEQREGYDMIILKFKYQFQFDTYDKFQKSKYHFRDDMIISLVCYQWSRRYDKADLSWYEISR